MNILNKYNKNVNLFTAKPAENVQYTNLKELYLHNGEDATYKVLNLYINTKSRFGDSPVVLVTPTLMVNLPKHLLETVKEIREDVEFIDFCNKGLIGFKIYEYSNDNGVGYSVNWVEIESDYPF